MNTLNVHFPDLKQPVARDEARKETNYHDFRGLRHETKDVLLQLQANIQKLEDLGGRLGFVLAEVGSLIRR